MNKHRKPGLVRAPRPESGDIGLQAAMPLGRNQRATWEGHTIPITGGQTRKIIDGYEHGDYDEDRVPAKVAEAIAERRRHGSAFSLPSIEITAQGFTADEISAVATNVLQWYSRPIVRTDEDVADRLNEFFARTVTLGEIPTVEKMALALGTTVSTVSRWQQGAMGKTRAAMIERAKDIISAIDAELVVTGKIPVVPYIFRAKNFYGMSDQREIVVAKQDPFETSTPEEVAAKYAASLPDE